MEWSVIGYRECVIHKVMGRDEMRERRGREGVEGGDEEGGEMDGVKRGGGGEDEEGKVMQ